MSSTVTIRMKDRCKFKNRGEVPNGTPGKLKSLEEQLDKIVGGGVERCLDSYSNSGNMEFLQEPKNSDRCYLNKGRR